MDAVSGNPCVLCADESLSSGDQLGGSSKVGTRVGIVAADKNLETKASTAVTTEVATDDKNLQATASPFLQL